MTLPPNPIMKIEFIQEMNPNIKNKDPMIKIEIMVYCLIKEPTFTIIYFLLIINKFSDLNWLFIPLIFYPGNIFFSP